MQMEKWLFTNPDMKFQNSALQSPNSVRSSVLSHSLAQARNEDWIIPASLQPLARQHGRGIPLRLQAGHAPLTVANLLGQVFERFTGAAHHIAKFQRLSNGVDGLGQNTHRCAADPQERLWLQPARFSRTLALCGLPCEGRGQLSDGLFLGGRVVLTARADPFCYADGCVPGPLTKPISKGRSR